MIGKQWPHSAGLTLVLCGVPVSFVVQSGNISAASLKRREKQENFLPLLRCFSLSHEEPRTPRKKNKIMSSYLPVFCKDENVFLVYFYLACFFDFCFVFSPRFAKQYLHSIFLYRIYITLKNHLVSCRENLAQKFSWEPLGGPKFASRFIFSPKQYPRKAITGPETPRVKKKKKKKEAMIIVFDLLSCRKTRQSVSFVC